MDLMAQLRQAAETGNMTVPSCDYNQWRVDKYNRAAGNLTGYDCPVCHNKGHVMFLSEDGYELTKPCACMEKRQSLWRMEKSGLSDTIERYRFDTFEVKNSLQKSVKEMALSFCSEGKGWFFIGGQVGAGKTHICTAIANHFMGKGHGVKYMIWVDEVTRLKSMKVNSEDFEEIYNDEINKLKTVAVLYIDDFFKTERGKSPTTADINIAFELLNYRYNDSSKITIISSEFTLSDVIGMDEATGSRIFQRCGKYKANIGRAQERNYRLREVE